MNIEQGTTFRQIFKMVVENGFDFKWPEIRMALWLIIGRITFFPERFFRILSFVLKSHIYAMTG